MKMGSFALIAGDITTAATDVIVNAANSKMLGGGGVDGAIHRAAGPKLLEACRGVPAINGIRCPAGQARLTLSGNLSAQYVIHTVGPRYGVDKDPSALLASCYQNSLDLAIDNQCHSIAFPAISCGAYGFPLGDAADVAIRTCHRLEYRGLDIYFYLYGQKTVDTWQSVYFRFAQSCE